MTRYDLFKLLHIVGAIAWIGGGMGLLVLSRRFIAARDYAALLSVGKHSQALGTWLFMPASLVTIGFGVAMVATEPTLRFADLWILIGFGGVVASGIAQMAVAAPAEKRFTAFAGERGLDHPDVDAAARKVAHGNALDIGLLLIVVWAMVTKPTM